MPNRDGTRVSGSREWSLRGLTRGRMAKSAGEKQSSRRQNHRRDIVPPIAIYIHPSLQPTLCFCHPRVSIPLRSPFFARTHLSPSGSTPRIDPYSALFTSTIPLRGFSAAFHLRGSHNYSLPLSLFTTLRHHCAFATVPQCSRTLCRCGFGRGGDWWATLGTTSSTKKRVYGAAAGGALLYVVFFISRVGGLAFVGCADSESLDNSRRLDRRLRLRPSASICAAIDTSNASKLLLYASANLFNHGLFLLLRIKEESSQ